MTVKKKNEYIAKLSAVKILIDIASKKNEEEEE